MASNLFGAPISSLRVGPSLFGGPEKKKRKTLTAKQRVYIWEHPNMYGRTCGVCHQRITKLSDLELDHTRAYSKGGTKLALAHRDCNRMKGSGSLGKIQKTLGFKTTKRKSATKKKRKSSSSYSLLGSMPKMKMPRSGRIRLG